MVQEHRGLPSLWAAIESIAPRLICVPQTLYEMGQAIRSRCWRARRRHYQRGATGQDLEREVKEPRRANEILKLASAFFAQAGSTADSSPEGFHRQATRYLWGRADLRRAAGRPVGYRRHAALRREPHRRSARARRDESLVPQIERVWQANMQVYGADKVWRQPVERHDCRALHGRAFDVAPGGCAA